MEKNPTKNKKITIDDLAMMVAKGFESVEKDISEVKKDISEVKKDISEVKKDISEVKKDISEVKENLSATRDDVLNMGDRFVPRYEFHDLLIRFDRLEQKVKGR